MGGKTYYMLVIQGGSVSRIHAPMKLKNFRLFQTLSLMHTSLLIRKPLEIKKLHISTQRDCTSAMEQRKQIPQFLQQNLKKRPYFKDLTVKNHKFYKTSIGTTGKTRRCNPFNHNTVHSWSATLPETTRKHRLKRPLLVMLFTR